MRTNSLKGPSTVVISLLAAATLSACASTVSTAKFKGPSQAVAQRIADFQSNVTNGDEQKLCKNDLASVVQTRLRAAGGNCVQALKNQLGAIDDFEIAVKSIAVNGTRATARVKSTWSGKARPSTLQFVKEAGIWKIAGAQ